MPDSAWLARRRPSKVKGQPQQPPPAQQQRPAQSAPQQVPAQQRPAQAAPQQAPAQQSAPAQQPRQATPPRQVTFDDGDDLDVPDFLK